MGEAMQERTVQQQELFESICQEFSSAKVVGLLVGCFGEELTGNALDNLGVAGVMSGAQLVKIYMRNRNNFELQGEQS